MINIKLGLNEAIKCTTKEWDIKVREKAYDLGLNWDGNKCDVGYADYFPIKGHTYYTIFNELFSSKYKDEVDGFIIISAEDWLSRFKNDIKKYPAVHTSGNPWDIVSLSVDSVDNKLKASDEAEKEAVEFVKVQRKKLDKMNKLEKQQEKVNKLKQKLEQAEEKLKELEGSKDYVLTLKISDCGDVAIYFLVGDKYHDVGYVMKTGECMVLSRDFLVENYELWREKGMKIDSDAKVEMNGSKFTLRSRDDGECYLDIDHYLMYNFDHCDFYVGVNIDWIKKHKHNNKPITY